MEDEDVKEAQRRFFGGNNAGCAFAAYAAKRPSKYGWKSTILPPDADGIKSALASAINEPETQAISMIFPSVTSTPGLISLIESCLQTGVISDEGFDTEGVRLVRLRAKVGKDLSWVSGFGPFDFLPKTRQAPFCELTVRVKPRPQYDWYFKEPIDGVIHLADLHMCGLSERNLWKLWRASFVTTRKVLGHAPDQESAAKTTFSIPFQST